jgi:hypothetical protein
MTQFDNREKAFESKYAHDQELQFKVNARRNKLLGLWAASEMGLSGDAASQYAMEVVKSDFQEAGEEDVFRKVKGDLDAKSLGVSEHRVRKQMEDLLAEAKHQIQNEMK